MHGPERLEYARAYRYAFDSHNWGMNLLIGSLCQLVPIAGPIPAEVL